MKYAKIYFLSLFSCRVFTNVLITVVTLLLRLSGYNATPLVVTSGHLKLLHVQNRRFTFAAQNRKTTLSGLKLLPGGFI